jgi:hypothetical protein
MATTKWLDPSGWTLADWEDDTLTVLVDHLWNTLKGAADERQAFAEFSHSGGFDSDNEFPNFSDLKNLFNSSASSPNNAVKIQNAVLNPDLTVVETDTIKADGTASGSAEADFLTLSQILTEIFSYASGTLLHMIDSTNGTENALLQMAWVKQWFQVMDYPEYYAQTVTPSGNDFFDELEVQFISTRVEYDYDVGSSSPGLDQAKCLIVSPTSVSSAVDIYVTNDLNETAPFSTSQEVYDYAVSQMDSERATRSWQTTVGALTENINQQVFYRLVRSGTGTVDEWDYTIILAESGRIRFKPNESLRALSPESFQAKLYEYFYLSKVTTIDFNNFGAGYNEGESKFLELTADGSGWYYMSLESPDWTTFTIPADPGTDSTALKNEANQLNTLTPDGFNNVIIQANNSDGTAFEYYTA